MAKRKKNPVASKTTDNLKNITTQTTTINKNDLPSKSMATSNKSTESKGKSNTAPSTIEGTTTKKTNADGVWKTDAVQSEEKLLSSKDTTPIAKEVKAGKIIEQPEIGMKYDTKFDNELIDEAFQTHLERRRHLLVPIDVQALVVPHTTPVKIEPNKEQMKTLMQYDKRAPLKTHFIHREGDEDNDESDWRLHDAFTYTPNTPSTGGLEPGIHLFWKPPRSLLEGQLIENEDVMNEFEYKQTDGNVPPEYVSTEEKFQHPISFEDAIRNRVEFTTEPTDVKPLNETLKFPHLPDLWVIIRKKKFSGLTAPGKPNRALRNEPLVKAWVIDSVTLEVSSLNNFTPSKRNPLVPEMTAIGPETGDMHWTATYDNARGRFGFHDQLPDDTTATFDYMVCGWFTEESSDPAYMEAHASEEVWFSKMRDDLRWDVNRMDIDDDPSNWAAVYAYAISKEEGGEEK